MRRWWMVAGLSLGPGVASAQEAWSIDDALARVQQTNESIDIAEFGEQRATGQAMQAVGAFVPNVSLSGTYQRTIKSEYDALFTTSGTTATSAPPTTTTGAGAISNPFENLPFGQDNTYRVDFVASQLLFAGGSLYASIKMARAGLGIADLGVDQARAAAAFEVTQAYFDAALTEQLVAIASGGLYQTQTVAEATRLGHEVGRTPEFELVRANVEVEAARVRLLQQERLRDLALLRLRQLLDLDPTTPVVLTTALDADADPTLAQRAATSAGVVETGTPAPIQQIEGLLDVAQGTLALARARLFPTLAASASYGWTSYPEEILPPTEDGSWYPNVGVGLSLSVPIFGGGATWGAVKVAAADKHEAEANARQVAEAVLLLTEDAASQLRDAEAQWAATAGTVDQAHRALAIAEVRYAEGVGTQTELADARLLLQQIQANRALSARDLLVARVRVTLLDSLPLQGAL